MPPKLLLIVKKEIKNEIYGMVTYLMFKDLILSKSVTTLILTYSAIAKNEQISHKI